MDRCYNCHNKYDRDTYIPMVLQCGDTLCSRCIESRKNGDKNIIYCTKCDKESATINLPINQAILNAAEAEENKKCPLHPKNSVGDLVCLTCSQEVCFSCSRAPPHNTHEVEVKANLYDEAQNKMIAIQETLELMKAKFYAADNYIETKREYLNWVVDTKFDQLLLEIEKMRKDAKEKVSQTLTSTCLNEFYQIKDLNAKMWKVDIEDKLQAWNNSNSNVRTMCQIMRDDNVNKIPFMKEWANQDRTQKLKCELDKIFLSFSQDVINHYFNINTEEYTKGGNNPQDNEIVIKEQTKILETCDIKDEVMNYEERSPLLEQTKILDLRRSKSIRSISGVINSLSELEEGYSNIRFDAKNNLSFIRASFSTLRRFEVKIGDDANPNCLQSLSEFLLTTNKLQVLKLEISNKLRDRNFIVLLDRIRKLRELKSLAIIFSNTDLPIDSISFSEKISNFHELTKLESFELTFDECKDPTNSFSDKKLIEALTTLNKGLASKGNKIKSYSVNLIDFDFDTPQIEEYLSTLEKFKNLTVLELRIGIGVYMSSCYHKILTIISQCEFLKLLYLELESKDSSSEPIDCKVFWELVSSKKELRALLIKLKNFENNSYCFDYLFDYLSKLENLEEIDLNFYKDGKNFRIQLTDDEFKKCGQFLSKKKKLEIFRLTVPSLITFENLKDLIVGTKGLPCLKTFAIDFDTEFQDEGSLKKLLKENMPRTVTNIDLELRVSRRRDNKAQDDAAAASQRLDL